MKKILLLSFLFTAALTAQDKLFLFPGKLNIQPYTANIIEPKLGFLFQMNENELRMDIGNSIDALHLKLDEQSTLSFGFDLFTYTLLRGEPNFHFPVDAVDYLFGFNLGYKISAQESEFGARLRISHISAHFVDGHYDGPNQQWRNGLNPRVYSREFLEFMPYFKWNELRVYGGFTYIFHVDPTDLGKESYQIGFDYFLKNIISNWITPFAAYDIKLVDIYSRTANHSVNTGIKIGNPEGQGVSIYYHYYPGFSVHGEYFDFRKEYSAIGINLDL